MQGLDILYICDPFCVTVLVSVIQSTNRNFQSEGDGNYEYHSRKLLL